jgi:hypothetical protein
MVAPFPFRRIPMLALITITVRTRMAGFTAITDLGHASMGEEGGGGMAGADMAGQVTAGEVMVGQDVVGAETEEMRLWVKFSSIDFCK